MSQNEPIEKLIIAKGLTLDLFSALDEAVLIEQEHIEGFKTIQSRLSEELKAHFIERVYYDYTAPISEYDIEKMQDNLKAKKLHYAEAIKRMVHLKFPNLLFDEEAFKKFLKTQTPFNTQAIMIYLFETYGVNEELQTLAQIHKWARKGLPWTREKEWFQAKNPEELSTGKTWVKLESIYEDNIAWISAFAEIVIGKVKPSEAKPWEKAKEGQDHYGDNYNRITFFKNKTCKISFNSPEDLKTFTHALFKTPEQILEDISS